MGKSETDYASPGSEKPCGIKFTSQPDPYRIREPTTFKTNKTNKELQH
jgi:hypothetical protein